MIVPPVDHHVGALRHVARRAGKRRIHRLVPLMGGYRILGGGVTLQADAIGRSAELGAVRLVAIAAGDTRREHLALLERAVVVDLVQHLPVGLIKSLTYRRDCVRLGKPSARSPCFGELAAASVAEAAGFDLRPQDSRRAAANGIAGHGIDRPGRITPFRKVFRQPLGRNDQLSKRPPGFLIARPGDVTRSLAVTRLAADADLGKRRGISVVLGVVVLAHAGRVALRAHEVPVLVQLGPMQDVIVLDLLVRVEMKPALAALLLWAAVPGDRQRLQPTVGKLDQILLQRIDAEGVFDLKYAERAVRPVGFDEESSVLAKEARVHIVIVETRVGKIAKNGLVVGMGHRVVMLRAAPESCLCPMAAGAGLAADKGRRT